MSKFDDAPMSEQEKIDAIRSRFLVFEPTHYELRKYMRHVIPNAMRQADGVYAGENAKVIPHFFPYLFNETAVSQSTEYVRVQERKSFPNLGDPPFVARCKDIALAELLEAGIPRGASVFTTKEVEVYVTGSEADTLGRCGIMMPSACARSDTLWKQVHTVTAEVYDWEFRRNWYYWVCFSKRHPVSENVAIELFRLHGGTVRVEGSCACPAPNGSVDCYHVDTPAGLKALVEVLRREYECREAIHKAELKRLYG